MPKVPVTRRCRRSASGAPFPLVDQQAVGNERECERDGRPFARIQELEGRFGGWVRPNLTPVWWLRDPGSDGVRCPSLHQLGGDRLGHEHAIVQRLEHVYRSDQNEVVEGTGVGDDDHVGCSALCFSSPTRMVARSCSKSSTVYFSTLCFFRKQSSS